MKISDIINEKTIPKPTRSQCAVRQLSNVRYAQCVSLGYKSHDSSHTDGNGRQGVKGSGKRLRGKKAASEVHGGPVKDYSGPTRTGKRKN